MEQIDFRQTIERLKDTGFSPVPNMVETKLFALLKNCHKTTIP